MPYAGLQDAVRRALRAAHDPRAQDASLFALVRPDADPAEEAGFVDVVSRNLRLGRFLLLIAGDGIQESAEALADFLQRHVGLHFTLGLVELSLWRTPSGEVLVTPKILARTVQIERAVVRLDVGLSAAPPLFEPAPAPAGAALAKATTLTEDTFHEQLAKVDPALPDRLRALLAAPEPIGVYADLKSNMLLKAGLPDGRVASLATIDPQGRVFTDGVPAVAMSLGRLDLADTYKRALAAALPGGAVEDTGKVMGVRLVVEGRTPTLAALLGAQDTWVAAVGEYLDAAQSGDGRRVARHELPKADHRLSPAGAL